MERRSMAITGRFLDYVRCPLCSMWVPESEYDFENETHKLCMGNVMVVNKQ